MATRKPNQAAKAGSIACLDELEAVGKARVKQQMEWASGRYAARCALQPGAHVHARYRLCLKFMKI